MTDYQKWLKKVENEATRQGWEVSRNGKHKKFKSPAGRVVSCSLTPRNGYQVRFSVTRDLKKAGFDIVTIARA